MNANEQIVRNFWSFFDEAAFDKAAELMESTAIVRWCNTREIFKSRDNFILANKKYPGRWRIMVEKVLALEEMVISVARVEAEDHSFSLYVTSFFAFRDGRIAEIEEYWGDNGEPPEWRMKEKLAERY